MKKVSMLLVIAMVLCLLAACNQQAQPQPEAAETYETPIHLLMKYRLLTITKEEYRRLYHGVYWAEHDFEEAWASYNAEKDDNMSIMAGMVGENPQYGLHISDASPLNEAALADQRAHAESHALHLPEQVDEAYLVSYEYVITGSVDSYADSEQNRLVFRVGNRWYAG